MKMTVSLVLALVSSAPAMASPGPQGFGDEVRVADPLPVFGSAVVLDADADGQPDVIAAGIASSGPDLFMSLGVDGRLFSTALPLREGLESLRIEDLASGDLDGDGDLDIAYAGDNAQAHVGWFENLGDGFGPARSIAMGTERAYRVELCDINGDQRLDIVWLPFGSTVLWRPNLGGGVFGPTESLVSSAPFYVDLEVRDLDGDNDLDVIAVSRNAGRVDWWENLGGGTFAPVALLLGNLSSPNAMDMGDVDGDGHLDLVLALGGITGNTLYLATDLLTGGPLVAPLSISGVQAFELAQAVGGPLPDLLLWGGQQEPLSVRQNTGGAFGAPQVFAQAVGGTRGFEVADVDLDGVLDVVTVGLSQGTVWYGDGTGFGSATAISTSLAPVFPPLLTAGDVDGDGLGDLPIAETFQSRRVGTMRNLGAGRWSAPDDRSFLVDPLQIELLDLDGDDDPDIVASGGSFDSIRAEVLWLENVGSGAFADAEYLHADFADSGATFGIGDREGDGDLDLFWTHRAGFAFDHRFEWIVQSAPGVFVPGQALPNNSLSPEYRLADLDLDGDADLIEYSTSFTLLLRWRENTGSGDFGPGQAIAAPAGVARYSDLQVGDLDQDGRNDLVVGSADGVFWYPALSAGGFGGPQLIELGTGQDALVLLNDVNVDGRMDLFLSQGLPTGAALSSRWIENLGGGSFSLPMPLPESTPGSVALAVADLDGDLDLDVLKRRSDGGISWNPNLSRFGDGYCGPAATNSTGEWGAMSASGSLDLSANDVTLHAERLPATSFGYFLVATEASFVPATTGSQGNLCVGGAIGRLNRTPSEVFQVGTQGSVAVALDVTNVPTPTGSVSLMPGETRFFQAWYRDANPTVTSNFTNGLTLRFE